MAKPQGLVAFRWRAQNIDQILSMKHCINIYQMLLQEVPKDWNLSYISSLKKKGNQTECRNFRGIGETNYIGMMHDRILKIKRV